MTERCAAQTGYRSRLSLVDAWGMYHFPTLEEKRRAFRLMLKHLTLCHGHPYDTRAWDVRTYQKHCPYRPGQK